MIKIYNIFNMQQDTSHLLKDTDNLLRSILLNIYI